MYTPKFNYTDKLVSTLIKIENFRTILQLSDISYNTKFKLSNTIKAIDLVHLGNLLGLEITLKEAEKLTVGTIERTDDATNLLGNLKTGIDFIRSDNIENYSEAEIEILKYLNKLTISQLRENWDARFRNLNDKIDERFDNYINFRDKSITSEMIDEEISELVDWYKNYKFFVSDIVRIGVFLFRLIEISPFIAANKLTICLIADYLLIKNGYSYKIYSSTFRIFDTSEEKFLKSIEISRANADISVWLEFFSESVLKELLLVREDMGKMAEDDEKSRNQPFLGLSKRQLKILKYLQTVPSIQREDYCHMMEVSTMTAFRDLSDLVHKKLIKIEGRGRGTKYKLASA